MFLTGRLAGEAPRGVRSWGQGATVAERILRSLRHLRERVRGSDAFLGRQPLELLAKLRRELVVVGRHQRASVEAKVIGREDMDGPPDDVRDDEIAVIAVCESSNTNAVLKNTRRSPVSSPCSSRSLTVTGARIRNAVKAG